MELVEVEVGPPALWTYAGGDADRTVERLEACYRTHRTSVIRTIARSHDRSLDKFADAFRFRRREDRDG